VTLTDLITTLDALDVRLSARLVVDAPAGALSPELRDALAGYKPLLLEQVVREMARPEPPTRREGPEARAPDSLDSPSSSDRAKDRPWREQLPGWSAPWREGWGRKANYLEERHGLAPLAAEAQAFNEVAELKRSGDLSDDAGVGAILEALGVPKAAPPSNGAAREDTPPSFGWTTKGHVVELPRTPGMEKRDPVRLVAGLGWQEWRRVTEADRQYVVRSRPRTREGHRAGSQPGLTSASD
jgi:hypothetical protein